MCYICWFIIFLQFLKSCVLLAILYVTHLRDVQLKFFFLFTVHMYVFGFEQLLLSCIIQGCDCICSLCFKLYLGSIGSGVFKKTPCPVVVVFMCLGLLSHDSTKLYLLYFVTHCCTIDNNCGKADGLE